MAWRCTAPGAGFFPLFRLITRLESVRRSASVHLPTRTLAKSAAHSGSLAARWLPSSSAVVEFSRDNVWVQVGPPHTWTLWVPQQDESRAFEQPEAYYQAKQGNAGAMPVAQRVYQQMQTAFPDQEVEVPVEKGAPVLVPGRWSAGFRTSASAKSLPSRGRLPQLQPQP